MASEALMRFMEALKIIDSKEPDLEKRNIYTGLLYLSADVETLFKKIKILENEIELLKKPHH
jgi:hypothetical protein